MLSQLVRSAGEHDAWLLAMPSLACTGSLGSAAKSSPASSGADVELTDGDHAPQKVRRVSATRRIWHDELMPEPARLRPIRGMKIPLNCGNAGAACGVWFQDIGMACLRTSAWPG